MNRNHALIGVALGLAAIATLASSPEQEPTDTLLAHQLHLVDDSGEVYCTISPRYDDGSARFALSRGGGQVEILALANGGLAINLRSDEQPRLTVWGSDDGAGLAFPVLGSGGEVDIDATHGLFYSPATNFLLIDR